MPLPRPTYSITVSLIVENINFQIYFQSLTSQKNFCFPDHYCKIIFYSWSYRTSSRRFKNHFPIKYILIANLFHACGNFQIFFLKRFFQDLLREINTLLDLIKEFGCDDVVLRQICQQLVYYVVSISLNQLLG